MATGIRDKVVILGMGCSKFGERWDRNAEDLMVEAFEECLKDARIERNQIEAAWLGTAIEEQHVGKSGVPLAMALRLPYIPVTRVENYCATGTEAFRGAVYAVASGAVDIALALGVE
ncbi:MAG: acetyl-CoA acetyltransferase, partial [Pseudomonadota bacterium]